MTTLFALLGAAVLWLLFEIVGHIVGGLLGVVLGPVLTPVERLAGRLLSGRTVVLLWMLALASYGFLPYALSAVPLAVRTLGFVAFMGLTPLALVGTFALRDRRRARAAGLVVAQPRPVPVWHPAARVHSRSIDAGCT